MASIRYNAFLIQEKKKHHLDFSNYKLLVFKHYRPSDASKKEGINMMKALEMGMIKDAILGTQYSPEELASHFNVSKEDCIEIE